MAPRVYPRRVSIRRYVVPFSLPRGSLAYREPGWHVWTRSASEGPSETLVLDIRTWPPTVALRLPGYTQAAARRRDGRWVFHLEREDGWWLVVRDGEAQQVWPVPFGEPDWSRLPDDSWQVRSCRTDGRRLDALCFVGDQLLLVPILLGARDGRLPLLGTGDRGWQPVTGLPLLDGELTVDVQALPLGDGAPIVVWDGTIFEYAGGTFVRSFDAPPITGRCVPTGPEGLFAPVNRFQLIEIHRGQAPRRHPLGNASAGDLWPGPGGTLIIGEHRPVLYDPSVAQLRIVPRELADEGKMVGWSDAGYLLLASGDRTGAKWIDAVPADTLLAEPPRPADRVDPPPAIPRVVDGRAASRPRIAADPGTSTVVVLDDRCVSVRQLDAPTRCYSHHCELVAVVANDGVFSILDAEGVLYRALPDRIARSFQERIDTGVRYPLSMVGTAWGVVILSAEGVLRIDERGATQLPFDAAIAGAADAAGDVLLVGPGPRAAILRETELHPVAPPVCEVHAVTALGRGEWFGLGASGLIRFDGARWHDVQPLEAPGNHLLGLSDGRLAVASGLHHVGLAAPPQFHRTRSLLVYSEEFLHDAGPLEVIGLAQVGGQLIVGLNRDNGNIVTLDAPGILRFDPHPNQPHDSWLFIGDRRAMWA